MINADITFTEVYVTDTSAILRGTLREAIKENKIVGRLVIPTYHVTYFEKLARTGSSLGFTGLQELKIIRELVKSLQEIIELEYINEIPRKYRSIRDINPDDLAREIALELNAILITSDNILKQAAETIGLKTLYLKVKETEKLTIEKFFTNDTMSIHLKENVIPYAKRGKPGNWYFEELRDMPMTKEELEEIIREIIEHVKTSPNAFIEAERPGSTIVQLDKYRIVITKPPFSDGIEITAVRPIAKLSLEDYKLPQKLITRLEQQAEGILIAGAPGMGKTTFAQALAEFYYRRGKVVKTIESPRDMQLPDEVTQYSKNYGTSEELHDVLLLSRPDYTFFDEMRDTRDFELYTDLRLAGVGMVGVIHGTSPIDSIQRFIGRVELGMIPSIIDTVIFIENGKVSKVYELETVVKVPHGLREADLARPVVVVKNFITGDPEYELYVFGERTFVVPIKKKQTPREYKIKNSVLKIIRKYIPDEDIDVKMTDDGRVLIFVNAEYYNYMLGKTRKKLDRLGKRLGVEIEVRPSI
ncbi:MAG: Flp pilus assembly complex ATPase component TadA [Thermoproteales archaeon]|nr:Flp pilus assembly complex ATPase component TadA [Thermoproteales archaeon]